jgi:hypothetical protein
MSILSASAGGDAHDAIVIGFVTCCALLCRAIGCVTEREYDQHHDQHLCCANDYADVCP